MTVTVKVGEAKTRLSDLLAKVEAGEEIIKARGNELIARLVPIDDRERREAVIEALRALRGRFQPVSQEEIRAWEHEGHKY
jgi:antitoxin (DNA-binding transcriptional repressor) of toxin-antitoxin stability system